MSARHLTALVALLAFLCCQSHAASSKPNIVLIFADDLGWQETGFFTADNGGPHVTQEPLRGAKGSYYEGGIRVPMIVRWPGIVAPGSTCDTPVSNVDFYPTFLSAIGAPALAAPLDGESLLPLFKN